MLLNNMENKKITIPLVGISNIIVFLAFFFAKIYNKIDWSWFWVFSPLWIPLAFVLIILGIIGLAYLVCIIIDLF